MNVNQIRLYKQEAIRNTKLSFGGTRSRKKEIYKDERIKKVPIEQARSQVCLNYAEREAVRRKAKKGLKTCEFARKRPSTAEII